MRLSAQDQQIPCGTPVALDAGVHEDPAVFASNHWLMRLHVWARRCAVVAAVLALIAVVIDLRQEAERSMALPLDAVAPAPIPDYLATRLERPRYRHSVIAGGAYSADELAAAMREDAVVAEHHRDVDADRVHAVVTSGPRAAYVSYRIGHRVYWTRKPVHIPAGETLLTDGVREIRARCGNGVSDIPREPVSDLEPLAAELDEPIEDDSSTTGERALVNTAPVGPAYVPFFPLAQAAALGRDVPPGTPGELLPSTPLGLSAFLLDPAGAAFNDGTSVSAPGTDSTDRVSGGRPFLVGGNDPGGPTEGSNGGGPNGGGNNTGNENNGGGSNGGGNNNDNGNNGGGNNGGNNDPGPTIPTTLPGSEDLIEDPDEVPQVPEPGTMLLVGLGLAAAVARRLRTKD